MSEIAERVAKAIYENEPDATIESGSPVTDMIRSTWDQMPERGRRYYISQARAAIAAMKEPTDAVMDAAENTNRGGGYGDNGGIEADRYDPEEVWRAMIDAALK